jgi:hypothetical protein
MGRADVSSLLPLRRDGQAAWREGLRGGGFDMRPMHVVMLAGAVMAGCAHDSDGHVVRTGQVRFDAYSVTGPKNAQFTLESDGNWANGATRYERVGDQLRPVGGLGDLFRPYGYVQITHLPNGIRYTPSWSSGVTWTFITEEGTQFPTDLEIPLYFAARLGAGGPLGRALDPRPGRPGATADHRLRPGSLRDPGPAGRGLARPSGRVLSGAGLPGPRDSCPAHLHPERGVAEPGAPVALIFRPSGRVGTGLRPFGGR